MNDTQLSSQASNHIRPLSSKNSSALQSVELLKEELVNPYTVINKDINYLKNRPHMGSVTKLAVLAEMHNPFDKKQAEMALDAME
jgi:hypothetical protein|tara:strand:+ start:920 stop:1174 length:255 start_codon:yes stop_codon:yes gene_type:complete